MKKVKDTVNWCMLDESLIKLTKEDKVFELDSKVVEFMKKTGLNEEEGYEVEVEIDETKGKEGTIVKLSSKSTKTVATEKEEDKDEEVAKPTEEASGNKGSVKIATIKGVSVAKRSVKLAEDDKNNTWYNLTEDIDENGVKKLQGKVVKLAIEAVEKGNDIITAVEVVEESEAVYDKLVGSGGEKSRPSNDSYETNTQKSIEAQVSVEHAQILAGALCIPPTEVDQFVDNRARKNYLLIQELKKSV